MSSGYYRVPTWMSDRDYFSQKDPRRAQHVRAIETAERIENRIAASSGDGSYSVTVTRKEMPNV